MEKEVEERLRQKFTLIDRTDPAAIAAAQQVCLMLLSPVFLDPSTIYLLFQSFVCI